MLFIESVISHAVVLLVPHVMSVAAILNFSINANFGPNDYGCAYRLIL